MTGEEAETLAIRALAWIVGNEELLPVFLGATGTTASEIGARAEEPEFLAAVLDFLLMDDGWVMAFAGAAGVAPTAPLAARRRLPGGDLPSWT